MGEAERALADCDQAVILDGDHQSDAYLRRAELCMRLQKYELAVHDYEHVVRMEPDDLRVKKLLMDANDALDGCKNYYRIVGVERDASEDDIKKAYRKRALHFHPDRHPGATEQQRQGFEKEFKELGQAYGVLSDPVKKSRYDNEQE